MGRTVSGQVLSRMGKEEYEHTLQCLKRERMDEVFSVLSRYRGEDGTVQLSFGRIAAEAGVAKKCAMEAVDALLADGTLSLLAPGYGASACIYRINIPSCSSPDSGQIL